MQESDLPSGARFPELWTLAFGELKKLARARMRASGPLTLIDTTGLVNEAYLRMARMPELSLPERGQFFAYCAHVMRSVVVDLVRERQALRRGGEREKITLSTTLMEEQPEAEPLEVHAALEELSALEPRLAQVVEMRYFAGFTEIEIAQMLGVTERTVRRDWGKARVLLHSMLSA
ncbi:MAG TPA: ECF-type sigma factor [Steroidobacteraceae bacterium]|nr:ECF-type sigma factor [Steroidobacteraceae bacterium]